MRCTHWIAVASLLCCGACKSVASDDEPGQPPAGSSGGTSAADAPQGGGQSTGMQPGNGGGSGGSQSSQPPAGSGGAASKPDAGTSAPGGGEMKPDEPGTGGPDDAGSTMEPGADAGVGDAAVGMLGEGSCCEEHETPGCSNADLQVCVCEKVSSCCTEKWDLPCVLIVTNRYCQQGVRDCVCGTGDGQWGQTSCCESDWTDFCDTTGVNKCGEVRGCF